MTPIRVAKDAGHLALGAARYALRPRRTLVLILSSMRAGSTLLKALLAQAPDVSHLPEIGFSQYRRMPSFKAYDLVCRLSPRPIIVLKRPVFDGLVLPFAPAFLRLRIVLLVRSGLDVAQSVMEMTRTYHADYPEPWNPARCVAYWRDSYLTVLEHPELRFHDLITVKYEELVASPLDETARLFAFIGSTQRKGVDRYAQPEKFAWQWGSDDGGERIKSLRVSDEKLGTPPDTAIVEALRADPIATDLMRRFGYELPWEGSDRQ